MPERFQMQAGNPSYWEWQRRLPLHFDVKNFSIFCPCPAVSWADEFAAGWLVFMMKNISRKQCMIFDGYFQPDLQGQLGRKGSRAKILGKSACFKDNMAVRG